MSCRYVSCAREILEQIDDMKVKIDNIVVASGSGGTHSGLLIGLHDSQRPIPVIGINVSRSTQTQTTYIADMLKDDIKQLGCQQ